MANRTVIATVEIEFQINCDTDEEFEAAKQHIFERYDFRTIGKMGDGQFTSSMHWYGEFAASKFWQRNRSKVRSLSERPFKRGKR